MWLKIRIYAKFWTQLIKTRESINQKTNRYNTNIDRQSLTSVTKKDMKITPQQLHIPVLLDDVVRLLAPKKGETYLDLTAGYGGHASEVISHIGDEKFATLVDRDAFAISKLQEKFPAARIIHDDFANCVKTTDEHFDMILLDLGVSSVQFDFGERGFSFRTDAPLDMRMDVDQTLTAAKILASYSEKDLVRIFTEYGEEKGGISRRLAHEIVLTRRKQPIQTTGQLANLVIQIVGHSDGGRWHKTHPATKIFQALRIAVNDELGQLSRALEGVSRILNPDGRLAIITFQSLEDRLVKHFLRDHDAGRDLEQDFRILTKKPIEGKLNDVNNPRARSAKLRAAFKIK